MRGNKSKSTKPELKLRKALWHAGLRGFRIHWAKAPGKPDICYPGKRLAIFMHGCFWHRCPHCHPQMPKTNISFWQDKFQKIYQHLYREAGWQRITVWECQLPEHLDEIVQVIGLLHKGVPHGHAFAA